MYFIFFLSRNVESDHRRRKLPALDSKAAIREKREKEIQMKVCAACRSRFCPNSRAGSAAEEKVGGEEHGAALFFIFGRGYYGCVEQQ